MALSKRLSSTAIEEYDVNTPEKIYKYLQQFFNCIRYCQNQSTIIIPHINTRRPHRQYGYSKNTMNLSVYFCIDWISQFWNRWENPEHIPQFLQQYYNNITSLLIRHLLYNKDFQFEVEYPVFT